MSSTRKILIVDDDPNLCMGLNDLLEINGFAPTSFYQGIPAIAWAEKEAPLVALIDLLLEDLPGLEVIEGIKAVSPSTECIVLTAFPSQSSAIEAVNLGAYSYLQKPYNADQVLQVIRRAVEKRSATLALIESEQRFRQLYELSPGPYQSLDAGGHLLEVNAEWLAELGYERSEVIGRPFAEFLAGDGPALSLEWLLRFEAQGQVRGVDFEMKRKDGTTIAVSFEGSIAYDAQGRFLRSHWVFTNISERKRAEEALRQAMNWARSYLDISAVMIVAIGTGQQITLVNRKACSVLGYEEAELLGRNWFDTVLPADVRERVREAFGELVAGRGENWEYAENPVRTKRGEVRLISWHNTVLRDPVGAIVATLSSGEDITERKQADEEIRRLNEFNEGIVQGVSEGILLTDAEGIVTFANPALAEMLGFAPGELVGQDWQAIVALDQRDLLRAAQARREAGESVRYELMLGRKDGVRLPVLVSGRPRFEAETGDYTGTVAVMTDISERKRAEAQLKEQLDELLRWQDVMLDREDRIQELKREVNELRSRLGEPLRYHSHEIAGGAADGG